MIGGEEISLRVFARDSSMEVAVRAIRQIWPQAVFENGTTGCRYEGFEKIEFYHLPELFVYRDSQAADLWDELGAVDETRNTMIHLILDAESLTMVMDQKSPEMQNMIAAIVSSLQDENLSFMGFIP